MESKNEQEISRWLYDLCNPRTRENALNELCKRRAYYPELGPLVWHSFGTVASILQEIMTVYPTLSDIRGNITNFTNTNAMRVCNAVTLLQCVAGHPQTRADLVESNMVEFLWPFITMNNRLRGMEYMRLTALGVIASMLRGDIPRLGQCRLPMSSVVVYLLQRNIIQTCATVSQIGAHLSKTVAAYIIERILQNEAGLNIVCEFYLSKVITLLNDLASSVQPNEANSRLLRHVVRSLTQLSRNSKARNVMKVTILPQFRHLVAPRDDSREAQQSKQSYLYGNFDAYVRDDKM